MLVPSAGAALSDCGCAVGAASRAASGAAAEDEEGGGAGVEEGEGEREGWREGAVDNEGGVPNGTDPGERFKSAKCLTGAVSRTKTGVCAARGRTPLPARFSAR